MQQLITRAGDLIDYLIGLVIAIALLVFFWGLAKFVFRLGGDEKAVGDGRRLMVWGIITLFVMLTVWGLVGFVQSELGLPRTVEVKPGDEYEFCIPHGEPPVPGKPYCR